jgi:hypothetical protein
MLLQDGLKNAVGLLKYRWFVRVVHFASSELVRTQGDFRFRSVSKGRAVARYMYDLLIYNLPACVVDQFARSDSYCSCLSVYMYPEVITHTDVILLDQLSCSRFAALWL